MQTEKCAALWTQKKKLTGEIKMWKMERELGLRMGTTEGTIEISKRLLFNTSAFS